MIWASKGAKFCTLKTEFSVPVSGLFDYHQIEVGRKEGTSSRLSVQFLHIDPLFILFSISNLKTGSFSPSRAWSSLPSYPLQHWVKVPASDCILHRVALDSTFRTDFCNLQTEFANILLSIRC